VGNLLGNATFTQLTISERLTWFFYGMSRTIAVLFFFSHVRSAIILAIILCTWCTESTRNYFADVFPTFSFLRSIWRTRRIRHR